MIEKEIFPKLAEEGELYAYKLQNEFWYDIGKPADYIEGQGSYLKYHNIKSDKYNTNDNILIEKSSEIG